MGKSSSQKKFKPIYQKAGWVLLSLIVILQVIIDYRTSHKVDVQLSLWHVGLIFILGGALCLFWKSAKVPRHSYLGISFALAAINEVITNMISIFLPSLLYNLTFPNSSGGFSDDFLFLVGRYVLETFLILSLLLKWATQGKWKTVLFLALKVVSVAILVMILFFFVLQQFFPLF